MSGYKNELFSNLKIVRMNMSNQISFLCRLNLQDAERKETVLASIEDCISVIQDTIELEREAMEEEAELSDLQFSYESIYCDYKDTLRYISKIIN